MHLVVFSNIDIVILNLDRMLHYTIYSVRKYKNLFRSQDFQC